MAGKKQRAKGQSGNANSAGKRNEVVQDERLQAVVLTDSFETRFMPLTYEMPRCLMPLANVPLIEYTLEFLAKAGVHEVYLICTSHAEQVQEYIDNSKWNLPWSPFKVSTILALEARSVGDAMRDLDNRGLITGDFILVSGDLVTNMEFDRALEAHRARRAEDKEHIVTMCLSTATQSHRTRSCEPAVFMLDKSNDRCLYYQDIPLASSKRKTAVDIDPELLEGVEEFKLRNDLIDCHIDICSPLVPAIFQENFDYQYLRRDFVKGVLSSDLLKKHIYAYITKEYAARVESWQTYDAISQDFLARWCYPLVLDSNLLEDQTYSYESKHVYKEKDVILAQSCKIGKCTAIGSGSTIGEGTFIENSVIGRNCQIGANVKIINSYIWENSIIGDNSVLNHSIVAAGAKLGSAVTLEDGCVIGFNVVVASSKTIPSGTRISAAPITVSSMSVPTPSYSSDEDSDEDSGLHPATRSKSTAKAVQLVGESGVGYIYESDDSDDSEETDDCDGAGANTLCTRMDELYLSDSSIYSASKTKKRRTLSTASYYTDWEDGSDASEEEEDFEKEAIATVERAMEHNHDIDTALLELNTLRMSLNVTYHEVRAATVSAMLKRVYHFIATQTLGPKDAVAKVFAHWGPLFRRQAFTAAEYVDLMDVILHRVVSMRFDRPDFILFCVYSCLYDSDILDEDVVYQWWAAAAADPAHADVKTLTAKWVDWLQTADEESGDDSGDDSDE
ncbi:AGL094Wp [Eremothecium gossypii ATCC 10895]|uniref:Translation initiation factor eIF2B subunit epsilon n=2 Tax=Eremothecium gossypii TaxID=33169 RepID=Q750P2_EREGS|nr:AGL094Wp [Eremothecium gossypii ATCC 10895]AAS54396.1 AGL094Wp [Eremothecium gossypii ATCC 10895]